MNIRSVSNNSNNTTTTLGVGGLVGAGSSSYTSRLPVLSEGRPEEMEPLIPPRTTSKALSGALCGNNFIHGKAPSRLGCTRSAGIVPLLHSSPLGGGNPYDNVRSRSSEHLVGSLPPPALAAAAICRNASSVDEISSLNHVSSSSSSISSSDDESFSNLTTTNEDEDYGQGGTTTGGESPPLGGPCPWIYPSDVQIDPSSLEVDSPKSSSPPSSPWSLIRVCHQRNPVKPHQALLPFVTVSTFQAVLSPVAVGCPPPWSPST
eukprot:TRINITY_DN2212_c1_g1_i1.p1 TRINITY_DN2212_c1_g1~~TRINITY_DN2212_c1_g1_i1.p1  ORF type:complete len:274 (+),score=67.02 TRINITY_DN2212_c1_g1_i1:38-823(+)